MYGGKLIDTLIGEPDELHWAARTRKIYFAYTGDQSSWEAPWLYIIIFRGSLMGTPIWDLQRRSKSWESYSKNKWMPLGPRWSRRISDLMRIAEIDHITNDQPCSE